MYEYLAAGMPIIATKILAHTNVLERNDFVFWDLNGNTNTLIEAIVEASRARSKLKVLGEKAQNYSKNFSWKKSAANLSKGFSEIFD
jgi:glycosyltransferase involved in cell wall biosynthesis